MELIEIKKVNEAYVKVIASDPGITMELYEYFTFEVPGARFSPKVKNKVWDGKIRLYNSMSKTLYSGLIPYVLRFAEERHYEVSVEKSLYPEGGYPDDFGVELRKKYKIPEHFEYREYQNDTIVDCLNNNRRLFVSPTGSGKSLIMYLLCRHFNDLKNKVLIVVPTTALVYQMKTDFIEYNNNKMLDIHTILAGEEKSTDSKITVSTWQSIYKLDKSWFDPFDVVIGDEAHNFKSKSLVTILTNLTDCKYRFGFTGTLDGTKTNKLILEGLFGSAKQIVTTKQLQDDGYLSPLKIKAIILNHSDETKKRYVKSDYDQELDYLVRNENRNKFITNLANDLDGNTLILFRYVEKHGKILYPMLEKGDKKNAHFIYGGIPASKREEIREIVESSENNIILASYGTFSTGTNIKNLHNIIFASPAKGKIRNLQSIGRSLRVHKSKDHATLYDIVDNLQHGKRKNYALQHFAERAMIYSNEGFKFKMYTINLKD